MELAVLKTRNCVLYSNFVLFCFVLRLGVIKDKVSRYSWKRLTLQNYSRETLHNFIQESLNSGFAQVISLNAFRHKQFTIITSSVALELQRQLLGGVVELL